MGEGGGEMCVGGDRGVWLGGGVDVRGSVGEGGRMAGHTIHPSMSI